jgi:hypothetical protein
MWWDPAWWKLHHLERYHILMTEAKKNRLHMYDPRFIVISIVHETNPWTFSIPIDMTLTYFVEKSKYMSTTSNNYQLPSTVRKLIQKLYSLGITADPCQT